MAGLTPKDIQVEIKNDYVEEIEVSNDWDLVGITVATIHSMRGYELASRFRDKGVPVVMGGFHATLLPDEVKERCDAVVIGEAEYTWSELLKDFQNGHMKSLYKADRLHPLNGLPMPRYDLVPFEKYRYRALPVLTSRGCPNNCEYCSVTRFYGGTYRFRPVEEVVEDVKAARRISRLDYMMFVDDNIAARREYSQRLFEALIPLRMKWVCQCGLDFTDDPELLRLAVRAGMRSAFIGVETLDPSALKKVNKKINVVEDYSRKLAAFRRHGVSVSANIIFGFDNDDKRSMYHTFWFLVRCGVFANPYILTPYPGTRLFRRMEKEGRLLHRDWGRYTAYQTVFESRKILPEELEKEFWKLYRWFYSPLINVMRLLRRNWQSLLSIREWIFHTLMCYNAFIAWKYIRKKQPPYF